MIDPKVLQHFLNVAGNYGLAEDGQFGPKSFTAGRDYLADRRYPATWPDARTLIALEQLFLNATTSAGLLVDGIAGPITLKAAQAYNAKSIVPVKTIWPRQRDVPSFFGQDPRSIPIAYVTPAYQMYADYARRTTDKVSRFACHKLVKPALTRIFAGALELYGAKDLRRLNLDIFSGCRVVRRITGGTGWSMHSWGIAVDIDAANNEFRDTWASGKMDGPEYKPFVDLWYAEGAINLGRERNYDPMHFQFARL
jgi:hypothetical protein